jgi:hypothetical protein
VALDESMHDTKFPTLSSLSHQLAGTSLSSCPSCVAPVTPARLFLLLAAIFLYIFVSAYNSMPQSCV